MYAKSIMMYKRHRVARGRLFPVDGANVTDSTNRRLKGEGNKLNSKRIFIQS